jgi:hypothetical protein
MLHVPENIKRSGQPEGNPLPGMAVGPRGMEGARLTPPCRRQAHRRHLRGLGRVRARTDRRAYESRAGGRAGPWTQRGRPYKMTAAKVRLAQAAMGQPETKVEELCVELGVTRQTLYRHVAPDGSLRADGQRLLERRDLNPRLSSDFPHGRLCAGWSPRDVRPQPSDQRSCRQ